MTTLRNIDAETLRAWHERDQRRKDLERQARQLKVENDQVAGEIKAALEEEDKSEVRRGDFRARLVPGRPTVPWKEEFIRALGADAAAEVLAAAPVPLQLTIAPVG